MGHPEATHDKMKRRQASRIGDPFHGEEKSECGSVDWLRDSSGGAGKYATRKTIGEQGDTGAIDLGGEALFSGHGGISPGAENDDDGDECIRTCDQEAEFFGR